LFIRSQERRRATNEPQPAYCPEPRFEQALGNAAAQEALRPAAPSPAPAAGRRPTDAEQVAATHAAAADATARAQGQRAALDARLATMEQVAAPHLAARSAAFQTLRAELSPFLPSGIAPKSEIVEGTGFPRGETAGVPSRVLRAPLDPTRPQLVAFATAEGQQTLEGKLDAFRAERTKGEIGRTLGGLFRGKVAREHDAVPAMSILFDGSGIDAGIAEADGQLSGERAKDLMAGVATSRALEQANGSQRRLEKAATGRGLFGRVANRVFERSLPDARREVKSEGEASRRQVSDYVSSEARAQLLRNQASTEGRMTESGLPLDKVGLGAVFDRADTHLAPDSLNLFLQTEEGKKFWLEDIGGASSYAEADRLEAATSALHGKQALTNAALSAASARQGLYPTAEGSFFRLPADLTPEQRAAAQARVSAAYQASEGQPVPVEALRSLVR
jgi:hypothetical protein